MAMVTNHRSLEKRSPMTGDSKLTYTEVLYGMARLAEEVSRLHILELSLKAAQEGEARNEAFDEPSRVRIEIIQATSCSKAEQ